jgi:hypothetical protein
MKNAHFHSRYENNIALYLKVSGKGKNNARYNFAILATADEYLG